MSNLITTLVFKNSKKTNLIVSYLESGKIVLPDKEWKDLQAGEKWEVGVIEREKYSVAKKIKRIEDTFIYFDRNTNKFVFRKISGNKILEESFLQPERIETIYEYDETFVGQDFLYVSIFQEFYYKEKVEKVYNKRIGLFEFYQEILKGKRLVTDEVKRQLNSNMHLFSLCKTNGTVFVNLKVKEEKAVVNL